MLLRRVAYSCALVLIAFAQGSGQQAAVAASPLTSCGPVSASFGTSQVFAVRAMPVSVRLVADALARDAQLYIFAAPAFEVRLVAGAEPGAHADLESSVIELTEGAVEQGWSDDELYAVLAHELGHLVSKARRTAGCLATEAEQQQDELAADAFAVDLLKAASRDPRSLARVLARFPDPVPKPGEPRTHPPLVKRLQSIETAAQA